MPLTHFQDVLKELDRDLATASPEQVPRLLSRISNDLFGLLIWRRPQLTAYENLSHYLAQLPPDDVQRRFTGGHGEQLLPRTCFFVNYLELMVISEFGTKSLKYLDYGCGWGRFTRFLPRFSSIDNIFAVDSNPGCADHFEGTILGQRFFPVEPVPTEAPFEEKFDVVFLFSVITHTPPPVTEKLAACLYELIRPGGLLVFTLRPKSYWNYYKNYPSHTNAEELASSHDAQGWAFLPQGGSQTYGDASYSDAQIQRLFHGFEVQDRTFTVADPFQILMAFRRR